MEPTYARSSVFVCVVALLLSSSKPSVAFEDEDGGPYRGLGAESCRQYLADVASDRDAEQLYSAWLAGYVTVAYSQLPSPQILEDASALHAANDWIKSYCIHRASDTYLAATVSLLTERERTVH